MSTLGQRVRELRIARNWSTIDVARYTGLTQGNISHIENERVSAPKLQTLKALAKLFNVSVNYLRTGEQ